MGYANCKQRRGVSRLRGVNGMKKKIILVDDSITNLALGKDSLSKLYDVLTTPSGKALFSALKNYFPDLILLDLDMPEMSGYEILEKLKAIKEYSEIPVIVLTAREDNESHERALELGARDIILKPYNPKLLTNLIGRFFSIQKQNEKLLEYEEAIDDHIFKQRSSSIILQDSLIDALVNLSENKSNNALHQIGRFRKYISIFSNELRNYNLYKNEIQLFGDDSFITAAQFHDIGKIAIEDSILQKLEELTNDEFESIKQHTFWGVKIIERIEQNISNKDLLLNAKLFASSHHEYWNGGGYPFGLKEQDIPIQGRVMAIIDVYDALVSDRPYKKAISHEEALRIIQAEAGSHFDPMMVNIFKEVSDEFATISLKKR